LFAFWRRRLGGQAVIEEARLDADLVLMAITPDRRRFALSEGWSVAEVRTVEELRGEDLIDFDASAYDVFANGYGLHY
jgi:hypothetical protein